MKAKVRSRDIMQRGGGYVTPFFSRALEKCTTSDMVNFVGTTYIFIQNSCLYGLYILISFAHNNSQKGARFAKAP